MDKKGKGKMKELDEEDVDVSTLLLKPTTASSSRGVPSTMMTYAASSSRGAPSMMTYAAASGFYQPRPGGNNMRPISMSNVRMQQQQLPLLAPAAAAQQGQTKTELCRWYLPGFSHCLSGNQCKFAHGIHEMRSISHDPNYKTKDCHTDAAGHEKCKYGEKCRFIHGYSLFGAHPRITKALHHATAALMHDALTRQQEEEEEAAALLQDAFTAHQEDQEFAAKSFSFTITKPPNSH